MQERLQKLLAGAGHGSRRGIEEWIRDGRVTINDRVAVLGDRATSADRICLDGRPLDLGGRRDSTEVLLYHKPVGEVTTRNDPEGRPTVFVHLPQLVQIAAQRDPMLAKVKPAILRETETTRVLSHAGLYCG